jgi:hypothetical protein
VAQRNLTMQSAMLSAYALAQLADARTAAA